jgi:hypothetical protein
MLRQDLNNIYPEIFATRVTAIKARPYKNTSFKNIKVRI